MARFEGIIQVIGFMNVVVDEPNLTIEQAKAKVQSRPQNYTEGDIESPLFQAWESFEKTEDDE